MFEIFDELVKQKGLTYYRIAKDTGISTTMFYDWKKGRSVPKVDKLKKIADYLGVSLEYLQNKSEQTNEVITKIPVLGYVPCGIPIEAVEDIVGYVNVTPRIKKDYFGLVAKGDSMAPDIKDGDLLIVKVKNIVDSGKIAIVKVNGDDATCKKVIINKDSITLLPLNNSYNPVTFTSDDVKSLPVTIVGEVEEIRRYL